MREIDKVLNADEKVVWEGKPQRLLFMFGVFITFAFSLIPVVVLGYFWFVQFSVAQAQSYMFWIWMFFILLSLWALVYGILSYKYIWYAITDKRVIFQKGVFGRDFNFVDYDKIESSEVEVSLTDKIFSKNTGCIRIYANRLVSHTSRDAQGRMTSSTENVPFVLASIVDPYGVFTLFKKISFDIKADINYPNTLRPQKNEGYNSQYTPENKI